jgi:hypothetical protein
MCQVCGRLHFINRSAGKLIGAKDPQPAGGSAAAQTAAAF